MSNLPRRQSSLSKAHWLIAAGLFVLAVVMRLGAIGNYITPDELAWVYRSMGLREALLAGDWAATIRTGHPGVTTTWLGAIGIQLTLWIRPESSADLAWLQNLFWFSPDYGEPLQHLAVFLTGGRLAVITVTSAGVALAYRIMARIWPMIGAVVAGLMLAVDPFQAGLGGLLHTDALLATFGLLAVLLAFGAFDLDDERPRLLEIGFAGALCGLAVLTKLPGVVVVAVVPFVIVWRILSAKGAENAKGKAIGLSFACWGLGLVAVILVLLPASWAAPVETFNRIVSIGSREAGMSGDVWFFGRNHSPNPIHFYLTILFFRLAPMTVFGFILLRQSKPPTRRFLLVALAFSLAFIAVLTFSDRVFDRYIVPVATLLTVASGLICGDWLLSREKTKYAPGMIFGLILFFGLGNRQQPLLAYNWLAGSYATASRVLPVGWGEDYGQAMHQIEAEATSDDSTIFSANVPSVAGFTNKEVYWLNDVSLINLEPHDYVIVPIGSPGQTEGVVSQSPLVDQLIATYEPVFTAGDGRTRLGIYSGISNSDLGLSSIETTAQNVRFDQSIELVSAGAALSTVSNDVIIRTTWLPGSQQLESDDLSLRLNIQDESGHIWRSDELRMVNRAGFRTSMWRPGREQTIDYVMWLPPAMPPGAYELSLTVFAQGERLGVFDSGDGGFEGTNRPISSFVWQQPVPQGAIEIPVEIRTSGAPGMRGFTPVERGIGQGETLTLDVWWQRLDGVMMEDVDVTIGSVELPVTLDLDDVPDGNVVHLRPAIEISAELDPGKYMVSFAGMSLGEIEVLDRNRSFELPAGIEPLGVQFSPLALLQSVAVDLAEQVAVDVVWQAAEAGETNLVSYVHLRDADGAILAQQDRSPGQPTGLWLAGQVVVDQFVFDGLDSAEIASVAIGLYDPDSGQRLPVYDAAGQPLADSQYVFDVTE